MKKICILFLLTMLNRFASAQINLVPNGSFEDTVACPINGRVYNCKYWVNCGKSPDYNHSCAPQVNNFGVPFNVFGYQVPATGNAYCDLWTYSTTGQYREFIGASLIQPMIIGHNYHVSFKCSPGDTTSNGYCLLTNKLGIRFSTVSFDSVNSPSINNYAHVYTDSIVKDTTDWTLVSKNFIADSAYTFIIIGNFFDDANTDTLISDFKCRFFSVYYIDDVEVIDSATGIDENNFESFIQHYQSGNELIINAGSYQINRAELYDCLGRKLIKVENKSAQVNFNVEKIVSGIYIVVLTTQKKLIKIKCQIQKK